MKVCKPLLVVIALCFMGVTGTVSAQAQERHPAYLHALSDLRLMRAYLSPITPRERIDEESQRAIGEIDEAIREIKEAAIDDHRDIRDHAAIDANIKPAGRFRKAREAGDAAWHDVNGEEDNGFARGLRHRALEHIEAANHIVDHIMRRFNR